MLRTSPGGPGLPLAPGHYPGYAGTGFDVFSVALRTGERLTARVALPAEAGGDPYAFLALNLRDGDVSSYARPSDGQRLELSSEPAAKDHEVYLVVAGEARPFDLTLELSGRRARDEEPFVPPRARATGPGIYPDRALQKEVFYALALGADQELTAAVRFDPNAGDLDLELLDPKGSRLAAATGTDAREQLTFVSPTAQRVYLRVFTYSAATVRYTLELALDGDTAPVEASVLPPGSHAGLRCAGDARHALRLGAGDLVRLKLAAATPPGAAPPDLDLALHDPSGLELARATALGPQEVLEHRAGTAGLYTVRVHGAEAEYTLSVELEPR